MESSDLTSRDVQVLREHINNPWNQLPATMKDIKEQVKERPTKCDAHFA